MRLWSGFGTKRNRLGAHGISGAECRPAVPSTWRHQPTRWSSSDVQREVSHRLKRDGNPLLDVVRAVNAAVDEQQFNDALTANLRMTLLRWTPNVGQPEPLPKV
jgi:hypothetical protein